MVQFMHIGRSRCVTPSVLRARLAPHLSLREINESNFGVLTFVWYEKQFLKTKNIT